jgi:small subunit ribosomal protein S8
MTMTDPIADMLSRIRNANTAYHKTVSVPFSKIKESIARILVNEGYIESFEITEDGIKKDLILTLKYNGKERIITGLERVSRPGLKNYAKRSKIPRVLGGLGVAIISTSKGVITGRKARAEGVGGEVICHIW